MFSRKIPYGQRHGRASRDLLKVEDCHVMLTFPAQQTYAEDCRPVVQIVNDL